MRLGGYEIQGPIGEGGMGVVYAGRSPDGRSVAIKVLQRHEPEVLARFERERRLLESLGEQEGFVALLDSGSTAQGPYLVMPFVPGGNLRRKLEAGPLAIEETIELGRGLAAALAAAHTRGIVHRDLKPENVLIAADGRPLIADLGLAKHFTDNVSGASKSVSLSRHGVTFGTAGYMPFEQMFDAKSVGPEADVFALGAILYESLTGAPAFVAESSFDVMKRVETGKFVPIAKARREVPPWLASVVERCLERNPTRRWKDGAALERALSREEEAAPEVRSRGALVPLAVLLLLASIGGAAFGIHRALRAAAARQACAEGALFTGAREYEKAARTYARAIESEPLLAEAWLGHAEALCWPGRYQEGAADATRAIELAPDLADAYRVRSWARNCLHDYAGALADGTRAIELDPKNAFAWSNRGSAKCRTSDPAGGIVDAGHALELDPRQAFAFLVRGECRDALGDHVGAIADLTLAIELEPDVAIAWGLRGTAKDNKGDVNGAMADWTRSLELNPRDTTTLCDRSWARTKKGDYDGGIADATKAIEIKPGLATAWYDRGVARADKDDHAGARADFTRAVELSPGLAVAWAERGKSRLELNDLPGAIADGTKAIELDPKLTSGWSCRGKARHASGDEDGAIADATKAIELEPTESVYWEERADARASKGDLEGAIADNLKIIELGDADAVASARSRLKVLAPGRR